MANTSANIKEGTYRIENMGFEETPKRVLDLKGSGGAPGTPVICWPDNGTENKQWSVTKFEGGYNFQCVNPSSNVFIGSIGPGEGVTGTPLQKTAFTLNDAGGSNRYQIVAQDNNRKYAFQASDNSSASVTLRPLVAANPKQVWRFVYLG